MPKGTAIVLAAKPTKKPHRVMRLFDRFIHYDILRGAGAYRSQGVC